MKSGKATSFTRIQCAQNPIHQQIRIHEDALYSEKRCKITIYFPNYQIISS